ncbi:stalk domain-containing protein [Cohnella terricola]|uniref:Copper amine oxidase-like N-terminal domain-containing protein n=1 Tax=Cohnella terricola TaxID=1289167 RepID=A0A559JBY1_9BACL|nr:stalk domain-containing protein [Cohnella terricola]TVX97379.1 hypothetical protein FPZ45_18780 [Cohnella terricola]
MRKLISLVIVMICFCIPLTVNAADKPIQVEIDGKKIQFDVDPIITQGTTLIQFRPIFEELGLSIGWDQKTKTVTGIKDGLTIKLTIGDKVAYVNDKKQNLTVAPSTIQGNTFVPLRFVGEATGRSVTHKDNVIAISDSSIYTKSSPNYIGELKDGKADGQGKIINSNNKLIYEGEFKNGKKEGKGIWYRLDDKYEGTFKDNWPNGQFVINYYVPEYKNGDSFLSKSVYPIRYEGGLKELKFDGKGTTFYDDGHKVVANYNNGLLDGERISYNSEGQITHDSYYVNGKLSGVSRSYNDGVLSIQTEYVDDKETGIYTQYDKDGSIALQVEKKDGVVVRDIVTPTSKYKNNTSTPSTSTASTSTPSTSIPNTSTPSTHDQEKNGYDKEYYSNGKLRYEGYWYRNKYDGTGKFYDNNGNLIYSGNFRNGMPDGTGTTYHANGNILYEGYMYRGLNGNDLIIYGTGKYYNQDGSLFYEGEMNNSKFNGKGKIYEGKNELYQEGNFIDSKLYGQGKQYMNGQLYYEGNFKDGKFDGYGKMYSNGSVYRVGKFKDGEYVGT